LVATTTKRKWLLRNTRQSPPYLPKNCNPWTARKRGNRGNTKAKKKKSRRHLSCERLPTIRGKLNFDRRKRCGTETFNQKKGKSVGEIIMGI